MPSIDALSLLISCAMALIGVVTLMRSLGKDKSDQGADLAQIKVTTTQTAAKLDKMDNKMDELSAKDAEMDKRILIAQMTADSAHKRLDDIGAPKER